MHFRKGAEALLTLEDRCSRLTLARRLRGMDADGCARAIIAELKPLPPPARRTLTCDNCSEFAAHARVTARTEIAAYFCDPGCPGQRGSIENTHGRLRDAPATAHQPRGDFRCRDRQTYFTISTR